MKRFIGKLLVAVALLLSVCPPIFAEHHDKIRVGLFFDKGVGKGEHRSGTAVKRMLLSSDDFDTRIIYGDDVRDGSLSNFDIVVFPGGLGGIEARDIGEEGRREVRRFVNDGGLYMGVCAGCYLASSARPSDIGLIPLRTADGKHWHRGEGKLPVEFTKLGMEVFGLSDADQRVFYANGPVFAMPDDKSQLDGMAPLSFFRGEFVAPGGEKGVMMNAPAMVLEHYGKGLVLGISPHPELTPGLEKIELNALRWMYAHRNAG
jgi:hypothetical protein